MNSLDFYTEVIGDDASVSTPKGGRVSDSAPEVGDISFSYTDAVVLSRKHDVDMQLADGVMWSNYSWINDGNEVRLDMSVGGLDVEDREATFRGSDSRFFNMAEALAGTAVEYLLVQAIDDESDFYKEWMWKNPSKELFEAVAGVVAEIRGSEPSAEDAAVLLDRDLPTSDSGYVQDSAVVEKIRGERVGKPVQKARVKDDAATITYRDAIDLGNNVGIDLDVTDGGLWGGGSWDHDDSTVTLVLDVFMDDRAAVEKLFAGSSKEESYEKASADQVHVILSDDDADFHKEWKWFKPSKETFSEIVSAVSEVLAGDGSSVEETAESLDRDLPAGSIVSDSVSDSAFASRVSGLINNSRVKDDASSTYTTLADALDDAQIPYTLDDYVIWSNELKFDGHGNQTDAGQIQIYGMVKDAYADPALDVLASRYDEVGDVAFYDQTPLEVLGIQVYDVNSNGGRSAEWNVLNPTPAQVKEVIDAALFCSEEHLSSEEVKSYLNEHFGKAVTDSVDQSASVYSDLADALSANGFAYGLDDYVIWSDAIELDNHDQGDSAQLIVYGMSEGVFEEEKLDAMDARYDEIGVDAFYDETALWRLGVQLFDTMDAAQQTAPIEYVVDNPTKTQVQEVLDAVAFCHEEHLGYDEAKAHLDEVFGPMKNAAHVDMAGVGDSSARVSDAAELEWRPKAGDGFVANIPGGSFVTSIFVEKGADDSWRTVLGSTNGVLSRDLKSAISKSGFSSDADAKKYAERVVSLLNDAGAAVLKLEE